MTEDERKLHSDDIARLKQRLGDEDMPYQDISREGELLDACRRWPLLAESEGWSSDHDVTQTQGSHKAPNL